MSSTRNSWASNHTKSLFSKGKDRSVGLSASAAPTWELCSFGCSDSSIFRKKKTEQLRMAESIDSLHSGRLLSSQRRKYMQVASSFFLHGHTQLPCILKTPELSTSHPRYYLSAYPAILYTTQGSLSMAVRTDLRLRKCLEDDTKWMNKQI